MTTAEPKLIAKLSMKGMGAQPAVRSVEKGESYAIAHLYGSASKHDVVTTTFGDSVRFLGNFEGVNVKTGEHYRAGKAFLPSIVSEILADAVDKLEDGQSVDFAFEIGVEYSEKGNTGYSYTVKPLVKLQESDSLSHLRELSQKAMAALPAPSKTEPEKGKPGRKPNK